MDFDAWLNQAWDDHADDAVAVAARLSTQGPALARRSEDVGALGRIVHHVFGEHLARYGDGRELLARLARHEHGAGAASDLRVFDASLALCAGTADARGTFAAPERIRIAALAAGNLAVVDAERAAHLLREAVAEAHAAALDDKDPACRALAIAGNNIATALEAKAHRTDEERTLMILAARTAREYWARAGTWLETERAEYRLARTWLQAGDPVEARRHAQACLAIVREHESPPLEAFFAWEALGLVERAAVDPVEYRRALAQAREAYARLDEGDRGWCTASLEALAN
jgi:hypothetical protein